MTVTLARTSEEYLAAALAAFHGRRDRGPRETGRSAPGGAPTPPPVVDPTGRHPWTRRVAGRLGLAVAPPTPDAAAPARLADATAALRGARPEHLVVSVGADGDCHAVAAGFALARNARLVIAGDDEAVLAAAAGAADDCRFLTLVGPTQQLDFHLVSRLRRRVPRTALGVLCAATPAALSFLVFKTLTYPHHPAPRDTLLAPLLKGSEPIESGRLTSYPRDAVDPAALARPHPVPVPTPDGSGEAGSASDGSASDGGAPGGSASDGGASEPGGAGHQELPLHRVFSVIAHGSEDYLRLTSDDLLCGLTPDPAERRAASTASAALPSCLRGDGCVYPDTRRWDPASVPAQIVFANACLTVKLNRQLFGSGNRFTVAQRFLDAWAGSYVASPLLKDGTPAENLLFHHLLEEGHPVGEAVVAVGESLRTWGVDAPEILLFGDPEAVYAAPPERPVPDTVTWEETPERVEVTFEGSIPGHTRIPLKDPALLDACRDGRLHLEAGAPFGGRLPVYATVTAMRDQTSLRVFSFDERPIGGDPPVRGVRGSTSPAPSAARRIVEAVERYENLAFLDIKLDRARPMLADAANSMPNLARRTKSAIADLTQSEGLHRATDRVLANCARLDRHLLDTLLRLTETREYHFVEAYRPTYAVRHVESPHGTCGYCGEVVHRYLSSHVLRPHLRRYLLSCPVCGATQDTEDDTVRLTVAGDPTLHPERPTHLALTMENTGTTPRDALLGARVTRGRSYGFTFRLDPETLHVPPGGSATAALTITSGTPPRRHAMLLRCYAVGMGRIDFAGRDLWFG